ncbi:MAG: TM0996/MTH895 family glutaredoxin-like protein [Elusimicrobia bacterium]|nr:TM0996/MTH895 family glutaredoxin-like protein [Elusimicrobiota bacterium]
MKIEIFGPGCPRCRRTEEAVRAALASAGVQAEVVKVTDVRAMTSRGVILTPTVMVDGRKVCEGKVPTPDAVRGWLR